MADPSSDLTALIARADFALGLEDHLWTDWRALVIDLRDALTAAEAQRRTVEQELEDANQQLTVLRPGGTHRTDNGRIVCQKLVDVSGDPR
jgi:hypothetical protein